MGCQGTAWADMKGLMGPWRGQANRATQAGASNAPWGGGGKAPDKARPPREPGDSEHS